MPPPFGAELLSSCLFQWPPKDPLMRFKYMKLKNRKGAKKAIVAIARNLIIRIRRILLHDEPYVVGMAA